jgi:PAS domain S-box-containing protein
LNWKKSLERAGDSLIPGPRESPPVPNTGQLQMESRIAAFDWSATPLGPIDGWSRSLRAMTDFLIRSPVPIVLLWGEDGTMIYNDAYSEFAGGRHPQLLGSKVREGWPEVADFNDHVMRTGLAGKTLSYQDQQLTLFRSGRPEKVSMNLDYSPVTGDDGEMAGVIAIVVETTQKVHAETRLKFLDELARETVQSDDADDILATTTRMTGEYLGVSICAYADMDEDQDGFSIRGDWSAPGSMSIVGHYRLVDFGKLAVRELGAGRPLIINDIPNEIEPDEAATFQAIGISATICMPLVKDGRLTALMAIHNNVPRAWSDEELALIREVTERAWANVQRVGVEAVLRASEENFRTLARAMPNHVWTSPPDGKLDWFNEQVYAFSGAETGKLDGDGWTMLVHPDDLAAAGGRWAEALETGDTYEAEFRLRRADGVWRWHIARAVPIKGEFGQVVRWIGTNTDIQDQKEIAEALADVNATLERRVEERTTELTRTADALRQAQKMEAVGQLTGGIAHDFNNLLGGIGGALEMIERHLNGHPVARVERYIGGAQDSVRRAASLTQRLLAFSRRQTLDPKPTDVNRLVEGLEELIRRTVGPSIELQVVTADGLWLTRVDPAQLESALLNLAINARDAMPDGGRIRIETARHHCDEAAAAKRELEAGDYLAICVSDTGSGMSPDVAERAFDPFFTTKPIGKGTGLGLSMVHGFVRQSGGEVTIDSTVVGGTTISLYLPRYQGSLEAAQAGEGRVIEGGRGETVLIIDDEEMIRMTASDTLREAGYRVLEAGDGPSGLALLNNGERIDLLVTDVGLPGGLNGRQVAEAARTRLPDLKILFITGYAEHSAIGEAHLDRGVGLITKPFSIRTLTARVKEMLDR